MNIQRIRSLLIEDNPGDARLVREVLRDTPEIDIHIVDRLSIGVEYLRSYETDVVLLDLGLPDSQGLDSLRTLSSAVPHVPVIVITGQDDEEIGRTAIRQGAQDYLVKPVVPGRMLARILRFAVERKRAEERERHLNTVLRAIRKVNQIITMVTDRDRLVQEACETLVSTQSFRNVWIVLMDESDIFVRAGEPGFGECFTKLKELLEQDRLPLCAQKALSQSGVVVIEDLSMCIDCPLVSFCQEWRAFSIRLEHGGKVYGILTASLPPAYALEKEEQELFREVGEDIAFALYSIEQEERRSKAGKDLKDSEERYRVIFEGVTEGILITETRTMKLKYANPAICKLLGYTEDEMKRMTVRDIHPDDVLKRIISEFEEYERENISMIQQDIACLKKDGTIIYADLVTTPRIIIDGSPHSASFFLDITERKKAEDDKKKMELQLLQAQKLEAVGRLTGGIAHDFNNILTTIIGNAEIILADLPKGDPMHEGMEEIKAAVDRAASLTGQLLAFSRKQVLQPTVMRLNETVREMDRMLCRIIGEDIELRTILAPDLGMVEADEGQIEQVIMNLVVNARDAMPKGGKITIETINAELDEGYARAHIAVIPGPYVMLSVSDTGGGMTREVQEHLFEPFFTTKEKGKGTGLGLSTVYGIVKQSKGNIWVYSEQGKGTTFKIYLPRVEKSISGTTRRDKEAGPVTGSETILIVEDDEMVRNFAARVLKGYGYRMLVAADGDEAVRISGDYEGPIHLMLTDVVMPGMNGEELGERLMVSRPGIKVLYMSGYTDNAIVHHGMLDKEKMFLQKPFSPDALGRKVREALRD